jgi:tyrosinase
MGIFTLSALLNNSYKYPRKFTVFLRMKRIKMKIITICAMAVMLTSLAYADAECPGDFNGDFTVDEADAQIFAENWLCGPQTSCGETDMDGNGKVDMIDFGLFFSYIGNTCEPTGACCAFSTVASGPDHMHCTQKTEAECMGTFWGVNTSCSADINGNNESDLCETDCNENFIPDQHEIANQTVQDCDGNGVPDACDPDSDNNGTPDTCDLLNCPENDPSCADCNGNAIPDSGDIANGTSNDCNNNGIPDECDLEAQSSSDCNENGNPDECDIATGVSLDCNENGEPDSCESCVIPGDMNGDLVIDQNDFTDFILSRNDPCPSTNSACADMDHDGDLDDADQQLFSDIIEGVKPAANFGVANIEPKEVATDTIVQLQMVGLDLDQDPDNYCIVAMNETEGTAIPLHGVSTETTPNGLLLNVQVGGIGPLDKPGTLMVAHGEGKFVNLQEELDRLNVQLFGARLIDPAWHWQAGQGVPALVQKFKLKIHPSFLSKLICYSPTTVGSLVDEKLCLTLRKGYPKGSKLQIVARAWDQTVYPAFGVDGFIPCLELTADLDTQQTAHAICTAIMALYAAAGVNIDCTTSVPTTGGVKITLMYPGRPITWGRISVRGPHIEIQVNNTSARNDDYVTWAPTICRARLVGADGTPGLKGALAMDVDVVMTNDSPNPAGAGNLQFASYTTPAGGGVWPAGWPANTTATASSVPLTLPAGGAWMQFVIAGEFGSPSTNDNDAIIEARVGSSLGPVCGKQCLMVRVRKNGNNLTVGERNRYIKAIRDLHNAGGYDVFQDIHAIASNEAHGTSAFLPWHRAFVVEYERALQGQDPSVSAHYWKYDAAAPNIFHSDFMGSNTPPSGAVVHASTNPLNGWTIDGLTPIQRGGSHDHTGVPSTNSDAVVLAATTFASFKGMEGNPHGSAHVWTSGWSGSIGTATRDPIFFMLHSNVERQWAKWQSLGHHGNGVNQYDVQGTYSCGSSDFKGEHLNDTMWPWNGITGAGACAGSNDDRPISAPGGTLAPPAASGFILGPPAMPTPYDTIDYLGRQDPTTGIGFCYDDVPYN